MTVALIQHPFRLRLDGTVATAEPGSDEHITSALGVLIGTRIGERPMCWNYGTPEPAFGQLTVDDVQAGVSLHGPDGIVITRITQTPVDEETSTATVTWARA